MPTSRKLLAVPFLGKDVPSPAASCAFDVVIGFTVLAYRYEGMRKSDFQVLADQLEQLQTQAERSRCPAAKTFNRWVTLAGGRVRGTRAGAGAAIEKVFRSGPLADRRRRRRKPGTCCCATRRS